MIGDDIGNWGLPDSIWDTEEKAIERQLVVESKGYRGVHVFLYALNEVDT
jgi:hypothetical protein